MFCLTGLTTLVLLIKKWLGLLLRKNHLLRCLNGLSRLNWIGALLLPVLLKLPPRKCNFDSFCEVYFSRGCSVSL